MKKIERATDLKSMLMAFEPLPIDETTRDFYYDNTMAIRTGDEYNSPLNRLFEECTTPSTSGNAHLLIGHRGCGKSTELFMLKEQFEKKGHAVITIDCQNEMNLSEAECWDFILFITYCILEIAEKTKVKIDEEVSKDIIGYIQPTTDGDTTKTVEFSLGISQLLEMILPIKASLSMSTTTREKLKENMGRHAIEWKRNITEISDNITSNCNGKQPILIFENVDRITDSNQLKKIFEYDTLAKMPFPIIYTFPIGLTYGSDTVLVRNYYKTHSLPMIKVYNDDKTESEVGIQTIKTIIEKRANLDLFDDKALNLLIVKTGGVLRHLFECIISSASRGMLRSHKHQIEEKIEVEDVNVALSDLSKGLMRVITGENKDILNGIYSSPLYIHGDNLNKDKFVNLLRHLIILEYENGEFWCVLHPLVADSLVKKGIIGVQR